MHFWEKNYVYSDSYYFGPARKHIIYELGTDKVTKPEGNPMINTDLISPKFLALFNLDYNHSLEGSKLELCPVTEIETNCFLF